MFISGDDYLLNALNQNNNYWIWKLVKIPALRKIEAAFLDVYFIFANDVNLACPRSKLDLLSPWWNITEY